MPIYRLTYTTISIVIESWEQLRRQKDYQHTAGSVMFQQYVSIVFFVIAMLTTQAQRHLMHLSCFLPFHRLFKREPRTKVLFGFPITVDTDSQELLNSKRFLMHAAYLIEMLDTALQMLGPDKDLLVEIMHELGVKHTRFGVTPDMFPRMGEALMHMLEIRLGDDFTPEVKEAWEKTYWALSNEMIVGQMMSK